MKHARVIVQSKIDRINATSIISIIDEDNGELICEIPLTYGDFVDLTIKERHAVGANAKFCDWYKIGKRRVVSTMRFELPMHNYMHRDKVAADMARINCPKGWSILVREDSCKQFTYNHIHPNVFAKTPICRYATDKELEQEQADAEKESAQENSNHQEVAVV